MCRCVRMCVDADILSPHTPVARHVITPSDAVSTSRRSTGIAEVSLPIEFKMRNIEETERARRWVPCSVKPRPTLSPLRLYMVATAGLYDLRHRRKIKP